MRDQAKVFHLDSIACGQSSELLVDDLALREVSLAPESRTYFDTFDWRLFRKGLTLERATSEDARRLRVRSLKGQLLAKTSLHSEPGFGWDLPEGAVRQMLVPIIEMRRLLPLLEVRSQGCRFDVLNDDRKTVVRMTMRNRKVVRPWESNLEETLPACLEVIPVRGYDKEFSQIIQVIESQLNVEEARLSELEVALEMLGRTPCDYTSKLRVKLEPEMAAGEAVRQIFQELLETLLANEKGTRLDLDSEFLHDFRVAIRRTRAALTQLKAVISLKIRDRFAPEFSWLGSITGPSRDLDVYLLKMPEFQNRVPLSIRDDLEPLTDFLVLEKATEQKRLVAALNSERYHTLIKEWRKALYNEPGDAFSTPSAVSIEEIASKRIWKIYRKVLRMGLQNGGSAEADVLHRLRIECKKLRYMMEFFRSLYDPGEIKSPIKTLRKLQENLGNFNDCEVQQFKLKEFARAMMDRGGFPPETFMALGCLVERLEKIQAEELGRFSTCFSDFSQTENQQRYRRLFSTKRKQAEKS